jgi:alcohol dehydrogenase class IV
MLSDSAFAWHMPVALEFGAGCLDRLAPALGDGPAVLLFEGADPLGLGQRLRSELGSRWAGSIEVPDGRCTIDRAAALARWVWPLLDAQAGAVLVAVGGGSVLDVAKLLRCRPQDDRFASLVDALRGNAPWPAQGLAPLCAYFTPSRTPISRDRGQRFTARRTPFHADRGQRFSVMADSGNARG